MKNLFILILIGLPELVTGQTIENSSFENWEMEGFENEPVDWSSIKTALPQSLADFAPVVLSQSSDALSGSSSVRLENISVFGVVANGVLTNGRVYADLNPDNGYMETITSDPKYNTPCTFRPDSLIGWYKYTPSSGDMLNVEVLLHTGSAKLPDVDSTNFVGYGIYVSANTTFASWTRFSIPIDYRSAGNPAYVLIILNSGNKTNAIDGSVALFDDLSLIGTTVGITQPLFGNSINVYAGFNQINFDARELEKDIRYDLRVHDILGKLVHRGSISSGSNYQISNLYPGLYICNMVSNKGFTITNKVIVQ